MAARLEEGAKDVALGMPLPTACDEPHECGRHDLLRNTAQFDCMYSSCMDKATFHGYNGCSEHTAVASMSPARGEGSTEASLNSANDTVSIAGACVSWWEGPIA